MQNIFYRVNNTNQQNQTFTLLTRITIDDLYSTFYAEFRNVNRFFYHAEFSCDLICNYQKMYHSCVYVTVKKLVIIHIYQ